MRAMTLSFVDFTGLRWPESANMTVFMAMKKAHETGKNQYFKNDFIDGKVTYKGEYAVLGCFAGPVFHIEAEHERGKIKATVINDEEVLYSIEEGSEIFGVPVPTGSPVNAHNN